MSNPPNNDAVKYFVEDIYPLILKEKMIKLYVVGRNPSPYIQSIKNEHVKVTGPVEDVRSYLTPNTIFVTPMISGTGIKNKILEAMSMELPVVSTSIGISGINAENGVEYILADTTEEFKEAIVKLSSDKDLRDKIGKNARIFVENNYSWETSMDRLESIIIKLIPWTIYLNTNKVIIR